MIDSEYVKWINKNILIEKIENKIKKREIEYDSAYFWNKGYICALEEIIEDIKKL